MSKIHWDLFKSISETPGAPGFEEPIRQLILKEIDSCVDSVEVDNMGNIIALKKGKSSEKKLMSAAHMDEISFIVTHISKKGFLRFHTLGGFDPKTLCSQRVWVHGKKDYLGVMGSKPIHVMKPEERKASPQTTDFYIDLGLKGDLVQKEIQIGNPITRERECIELGDCINGKSLDNRVAVYILIDTLKRLKDVEIPYDFYAAFTVQEEVGLRGAQVATQSIQPDYSICLDTTIAFDTPGAREEERITSLGGGVAIKILDSGSICDTRMVDFLESCCENKGIKNQREVLTGGSTDTAMMQRMTPGGAIAGCISIPTRNIHQTIESVHKEDVLGSIDLLEEAVKTMDQIKLQRRI